MIKKIQEALQKKKVEKTKKEYLRLLAENPRDTRSRLKLGDIYARGGQTAEAAGQ